MAGSRRGAPGRRRRIFVLTRLLPPPYHRFARAIVTADKLVLVAPNGAESLLYILHEYMKVRHLPRAHPPFLAADRWLLHPTRHLPSRPRGLGPHTPHYIASRDVNDKFTGPS